MSETDGCGVSSTEKRNLLLSNTCDVYAHPTPPSLVLLLRTLFVVVTVLAVFLGWVAYNLDWMRRRDAAFERLDDLCPKMTYEDGDEIPPYVGAPWPIRLFGDHSVTTRDWPMPLDEGDPELIQLRALFPELRLLARPTH